MKWYVIHTRPRQEERALENLLRQGFQAWLPMLEVEKVRRGKITKLIEPLFSRYLFIHLDQIHSNWSPIRSTLGVSKLVSFGNQPAAVPDELIQMLQQEPQRSGQKVLNPGDTVEFTKGPLKGLRGIYEQDDGELRAMVMIELINQSHRVQAHKDVLKPVSI